MPRLPDPYEQHVRRVTGPPPEPRTPAERYDLVVLGGGPAGLVAALGAAGLGARTALVERDLLGGDCLHGGCVPSKALLRAADIAAQVRVAGEFGLRARLDEVDLGAVLRRVRRVQASIAPHDGWERLQREGVDLFFGHGRFVASDAVEVEGARLHFRRCCIATGASPRRPPIPGVELALTARSVYRLQRLPGRLLVVGGGAMGCELGQAFARLGSQVTLVERSDQLLPGVDPEAVAVLAEALQHEGVDLRIGVEARAFGAVGEGRTATLSDGSRWRGDAILLAAGRTPNLDLALERAGIQTRDARLWVDAHLRTTNRRVYAAGDVLGAATTPMADRQARVVLANALFRARRTFDAGRIPRAVFTAPEVAWIGRIGGPGLERRSVPFTALDRARTDGETRGFAAVWVDPAGRLRGAVVAGPGAAELVGTVGVAIEGGVRLSDLAAVPFAYPSRSEILGRLGDRAQRARFRPWMRRALQRWFDLRRSW